MQPRLIRLRDIPKFLGMDMHRFNAEVRPHLTQIPIGKQGIAFDRLDLELWVDQYKHCNGRPGANRRHKWEKSTYQGYKKSAEYGTSTKELMEAVFAKALEQVT